MMTQFGKYYLGCLSFVKMMKNFGDALKQMLHQLTFLTRTWHLLDETLNGAGMEAPTEPGKATSAFVECRQINARIQS